MTGQLKRCMRRNISMQLNLSILLLISENFSKICLVKGMSGIFASLISMRHFQQKKKK